MDSKSNWINRLLPVCAIIIVSLMSVVKIGDYDIWYHLKFGEYVLKTGAISQLDPFSFTTPDLPWPVHSWLAAVIYFKLFSTAGAPGLIIFNSILLSATFILIYLTMRLFMEDEGEALFAAVILVVSAFAMRFRMWVRPHVFEFIYLAASIHILNLYRAKGKNLLFIVPVLQLLWVNTHGSQVLGLIVPLIFIFGAAAQALVFKCSGMKVSAKTFVMNTGLVFAANIVMTLANPDFQMALVSPFTILAPFIQNINEFQPLQLHHLWGYELRYTWGFVTLLLLGISGFILRGKRHDITDTLLFLAFLLMAVRGIRFMAEFAIVAGPVISKNLSGPVFRVLRPAAKPAGVILLMILLFVVSPLAFSSQTYKFGVGVKEGVFPEEAVSFIEKAGIKGNMFNSYGFGDYILWRTFPRMRVFIHGHSRAEVFPQELYKAYLDAHNSPEAWKALTEKYNINYTILEYYRTDYGGKEAVPHLMENPEWTPVYWDTLAIVYVKDVTENRDVIEKYGYKYIRPANLDFTYLDRYVKNGISGLPLGEIERLLALSPENEEAYLARAYIYFHLGEKRYADAIEDIKKAIAINPRQAMSHSALALLYQRTKDLNGAKEEYKKTLALDPGNPAALNGLKSLKEARH